MKRRKFVSNTVVTSAALMISPDITHELMSYPTSSNDQNPIFNVKINSNGSYDISNGHLSLEGCYPLWNELPIKPLSVSVNGNSITYRLHGATIKLKIEIKEGELYIKSSIDGLSTAPHWFAPMGIAKVSNAKKYFYQGLGFSGPSGFADITKEPYKTPLKTEIGRDENWMLESYHTSGLLDETGYTISIAALDHKNYLQKTTLYNKQQRFGLINRHLLDENIYLDASFATEEIPVTGTLQLPDLVLITGNVPIKVLGKTADKISKHMNATFTKPPRYHWCSWYIKGKEFSKKDLDKILLNIKNFNLSTQIQAVQIDDGYQQYYGDWLKIRPLWESDTMQPAFDAIKNSGMSAGVWIGAFMVDKSSSLFKNHPDWILKKKDGTYYEEIDGNCVILDTSHPQAFAYLREVFRTMKKWGATFYKTDFMDWGLQDSVVANRYTKGKTSVQYFREVLSMIREEIGQESYWLACIAPFAPFLGYADGVRIANDTTQDWGNFDNIVNQIIATHYFNNIYWQNDPDVMWLSPDSCRLADYEIKTIAYLFGICGGSVNTSEWLNTPEQIALWKFLQPSSKPSNAYFLNWAGDNNLEAIVRPYNDQKAFGLLVFNRSNKTESQSFTTKEIANIHVADFYAWSENGSIKLGEKTSIKLQLAPHESKLYYISLTGEGPLHGFTIGGYPPS